MTAAQHELDVNAPCTSNTVGAARRRAGPRLSMRSACPAGSRARVRRLTYVGLPGGGCQNAGQFGPRADPQLRVDAVEVSAHGPRREEEPAADVAVAQPDRGEL